MPEQPIVDGVLPPLRPQAGSSGGVNAVFLWKKRVLIVGGAFYLLYVVWAFFLAMMLPADGWEMLASVGVLTLIFGACAFLAVGAVGLMRVSRSVLPKNVRNRGFLVLLAVTVPGFLLSLVIPFLILREPPIGIDITSPRTAEEFVAPVQVAFSLESALKTLGNHGFRPIQYRWDINGDGKADQETVIPELTVTFDREGVYAVRVVLADAAGNLRQATRRFIIEQSVFTIAPSPVLVNRPAVLSIANLIKDPLQLSDVQWDFDNDGKVDETTKSPQTTYTFFRLGRTTVTATVTLQNKTQARYERSFEVTEPAPLSFPVTLVSEPRHLLSPPPFATLWRVETEEPVGQVLWDFGDGEKGEGMRTAHTFDQRGNFVVQAKVFAQSGSAAALSAVVQVVDPLSLGDLTFEGTPAVVGNRVEGEVPLIVNLKPRTSVPFVQFFWEAPEATEVGSTEANVQAIYRREGTYTLTLVASDAENHVLRQPITVSVKPPSSALTIRMDPETGIAPLLVRFDASETFIPGESITGFEWEFGDSSPVRIGGARIEHTFVREGTYTINLTVRTNSGKQFQTSRTIAVRAPVLAACLLASRTSGPAPLGVQFTSSCSTGTVHERLWDFGDGSQTDEEEPIHVFEEPGTYTVTLTITDDAKRSSTESVTLSVQP